MEEIDLLSDRDKRLKLARDILDVRQKQDPGLQIRLSNFDLAAIMIATFTEVQKWVTSEDGGRSQVCNLTTLVWICVLRPLCLGDIVHPNHGM